MSSAVLVAPRESVKTSRLSPTAVALSGITAIGLGLRAAGINHESLWLDEGYTLLFSRLPFPRVITVGGAHEHPPLYYVVCHLLFGVIPSPLLPRLVSLAAGTLLIPLVFLLGRRLISSEAGLAASLLLAVSPLAIWYSQDGRAYALASALVVGAYLLLLTALDRRSTAVWVLYALCVLACLYTEYTTVFALAPHVLFLRRGRRDLIAAWVGVVIGYLPWLSVLFRNTLTVAGDYWIPPPSLHAIQSTAVGFLGFVTPCPSPPCSGVSPLGFEALAPYLAIVVALSLLALTAWAGRTRSLPRLLLLAWVLVPFGTVLALSPFRSLYVDRAFVDTLPALLLILSAGLLALPRPAGAPLYAVLLAGNLATSALLFTTHSNPDFRSLARDLNAAYRPGDAVMYNPGVLRSLVGAYLPPSWHPDRERALWSRSYIDVPGWQRYYPQAGRTDRASRARIEAVLRNRQLASVATGEHHVWLISLDYSGLNDTRRWFIAHGYQVRMSELYDGNSRLELWSKEPPSALGPASVPALWRRDWVLSGPVHVSGGVAAEKQGALLSRSFPVEAGTMYSVQVLYRSWWGWPGLDLNVYDRSGALLTTFPRTSWYGFPVNDVWLSQPFGFVAPPGAARAQIVASTKWGEVDWRIIAVYHSVPPAR